VARGPLEAMECRGAIVERDDASSEGNVVHVDGVTGQDI